MLSILFLLFTPAAHALHFELVKPCSAELSLQKDLPAKAESLGQATVEILDAEKIPYIGSELGFNSILHSPYDRDAMEVTNEEIKAFGWCFEVEGKLIEKMPNEVALTGQEHVKWFYGFARLRKNDWVSYCEPSVNAKPGKVCP